MRACLVLALGALAAASQVCPAPLGGVGCGACAGCQGTYSSDPTYVDALTWRNCNDDGSCVFDFLESSAGVTCDPGFVAKLNTAASTCNSHYVRGLGGFWGGV